MAFVVVLGVLVFVHELGHYLAARWRGVHVEAFSIGFGQALATWTDRLGTVWKLAWIPLGGYVKLHGQERPQDVPPEVRARWLPGLTFQEKPVGSRAIIVAAGPVANFLLAPSCFSCCSRWSAVRLPCRSSTRSCPAPRPPQQECSPRTASSRSTGRRSRLRRPAADRVGPSRHADEGSGAAERHRRDLVRGDRCARRQWPKVGLLGIEGGVVAYQHLGSGRAMGGRDRNLAGYGRNSEGVAQIFAGGHGAGDIGGPLRIAQLSGEVARWARPAWFRSLPCCR